MAEPKPASVAHDLYERDFYAWTQEQAARLRARAGFDNRGDIDWAHAAEEIESVGAREKREIRNRLTVLLAHFLKWRFQPERRKEGWRLTIDEQRDCIAAVLEDSRSLRLFPGDVVADAYRGAVRRAAEETELPVATFPVECPFSIEEVLDPGFFPAAASQA